MRLVPYGPMFIDEVVTLVETHSKLTENPFGIEEALPYCTCVAYASPQPYRVLLENDTVVGWCRVDYGVELPGRPGLPSLHEFVALPGYHFKLLHAAEEELKRNGYEKYALWVRSDQNPMVQWAKKRKHFLTEFHVGLVDLQCEVKKDARG